ncbi:MAG: ABC transporter ATP-binding protein [Lachnospiraceae bacterium]|nr:ABC transporter ATP-binding protein [Lachnospiraceae bacterium]
MLDPIIEFQDFSFKYRAQQEPTLKQISLTIRQGEKVLIVGPSGSGKSTLAHCINGLIPFAFPGEITGTYRICGQDPQKLGIFGLNKLVGTVLQDTDGQFIGLTVAEDIAFALENDCVPQEEMIAGVREVAGQVAVEKLLHHAPGELSGGQKQRVSMAGVMVDDVEIFLFDEPLANLDPATGKRAIDLIDQIQKKRNATVVIIEHRLEDALYRDVDRIILFGEGEILADMTPDELLSTDLLLTNGIREPLYLAAIRHAGASVAPQDHPQHVEQMNLAPYIEPVKEWFCHVTLPPKKEAGEEQLRIEDLSYAYDHDINVLQHINFALHRGEMVSLVGKNGAGKSTLARLICGFMMPDHGRILFHEEDMAKLSVKERGDRVGYVMQNPNQMISKAMIYDEVALGLTVRGVPEEEIKERVYETLKICGLYPFRNWPISALSYGQKKRVTIASILVLKPEIMILDEATAGQDYHHYTEIMEFLRRINRELGITILLITHDMHLMLEYTDRAIVIADGEMLTDSTPADVLTREEIAGKAYLKKTSLYDLALACGIEEPAEFVNRFIYYEREHREN